MASIVVALARTVWFVAKAIVLGTGPLAKVLRVVALVAGAHAYERQQQKKAMRALAAQEVRTSNIRTTTGPALIVVGQTRIGGYVPFTTQSGANKQYTHLIIVHSWRECDSFVAHYLNSEALTLDGSGNVTAPAKWAGKVRIKTHLGADSQTVDTDLQTDVGSSLWSNDHRLRGWCYSYVRYQTDADVFSEGLPVYTVDLKGAKWHDPRTGTTIWSDNPWVVARGWMLLSKGNGGMGAAASEIPDSEFSAEANVCDETVALAAGGTEKRYTANGIIDTSRPRGEILEALCLATAGECPFYNGAFHPRSGAYGSVVMDLTDDDLVGETDTDPRDSARDAFNGVRGIYTSAKTQWQPGDAPEYKNDTYRTEDGGEHLWKDVVLDFTTSPSMAQRIFKIMLEESRQDITEVFPGKLKVLNLVPGSIVTRTSTPMGWSAKPFRVRSAGLVQIQDDNGNPLFVPGVVLRETAAGIYDWNNGEETAVDLAPNSTLTDPNTIPTPATPTLSTSNFVQADGTVTPRLKVVVTAPTDINVTAGGKLLLEYKKSSDSTWLPWSSASGSITEDYITDVLAGVSYDVRAQYETRLAKRGAYSATASHTVSTDVTAPATPGGLAAAAVVQGIRVSWSPNSEDDLAGYVLYRHTSNSFGGASEMWRGNATAFVDRNVSYGTTYYYWLKAIDRTDNLSTEADSVNAAAVKVDTGDIEDGAGTTVKLANGAVSQVTSVQASTSSGITNGSYTEVDAITVNADAGQDVIIQWSFAYADDGAAHSTAGFVRVLRDGTEIWGGDWSVDQGHTEFQAGNIVDPDLGSAVTEYTLEVKPTGGGGTATPSVRSPVLTAIILKDRLN